MYALNLATAGLSTNKAGSVSSSGVLFPAESCKKKEKKQQLSKRVDL